MNYKVGEWKPTEKQQAAMDYAEEHDWDFCIRDLCRTVDIAIRTYYNYFDTPDFRVWWNAAIDRYFVLHKPQIYAAIYKQAVSGETSKQTKGSHADRKLYLERFDVDYAPKSRQEQKIEASGVKVLFSDTPAAEALKKAKAITDEELGK